MNYRIRRILYFSVWLVIFVTILGEAIFTPLSTKTIAQVSQTNDTQSNELIKAREVTQDFFDALIAGQFEQAREYASPSLKEYLSATDLEQSWQQILDDMGAFVQYRGIRPTEVFDTYTVLVTANFKNKISDFVVTLDGNRQITAIDFLWIDNIQNNAEEFVDAVSNGQYGVARGYLAPDLKKTILPETIEQRWMDIIAATGPFRQRMSSRVVNSSSGSDVVLIDLEFERENRSFMIIFNPLGKIVGIDFPKSQE
ncbi:hypothetical protein STA3757_27260 [Stanieria sp. NIES-3757]|nr:hypothetical protein STA3757_27260 [Stanieria sp. NIES-3757]